MEDLRPHGRDYIPFTIGLGTYMNRALDFARKLNVDPQEREIVLENVRAYVKPTAPYFLYHIATTAAAILAIKVGLEKLLK